MSLATRCMCCGTIFHVAQEQLKISEGWVRCGNCHEMFNALKGLFDLERDTPPPWSPSDAPIKATPAPQETRSLTALPMSPAISEAARPSSPPRPAPPRLVEPQLLREDLSAAVELEPLPPRYAGQPEPLPFKALKPKSKSSTTRGVRSKERSRSSRDISRTDNRSGSEILGSVSRFFKPTAPAQLTGLSPEASPGPVPKFLRRAQQQAHWRSPAVRSALALLMFVLLLALCLQGVHHFRDALAARWPAAQPALAAWCDVVGCKIEPPRRIEAISVESTSFLRVGESDSFRFSVVLKNSSPPVVAMPSIELSLTDANGQLLSRRALSPLEFSAAPAFLRPQSEQPLQALLSASQQNVSGYNVELFYP
jgi:predicted Zn finger-like uncharacterized protein